MGSVAKAICVGVIAVAASVAVLRWRQRPDGHGVRRRHRW